MKLSEMRQVVDMLYDEWDLGKTPSRAVGKTCAWIYLFGILEESTKVILEKENQKVVGMCGYLKFGSKGKRRYQILRSILRHSPLIRNKKALCQYDKNYDYTPEELKLDFDGEISILIVDRHYRNKGIGKKILYKTFEKAKEDGIQNLQILTDESCHFKFYEACGCQKVFEKRIYNIEPSKCGTLKYEMGYIYERNIN
ncbi:MAG: GNAT family N-acetyltransferase [Clostridia bacterium]|nr:GNAT family N-acetyltransferase [Clostridia bacterium]